MTEESTGRSWLVVLVKVPAEPARYRMALWRELRRSGAVPLGQATWVLPDLPAVRPLVDRLAELVGPANGSLLLLAATGYAGADVARLEQLYSEARKAEWAEFEADCGKYLAELDKEERIGKFSLAELEEEEQSLDRLRRWYRELRSRDLLGVPATVDAAADLRQCEERFDRYADQVYATLSQPDRFPAGTDGRGGAR
ncbi:MAG: Chromate resistance protein ChrB [Propionibacteriaceae bacterium]